MITTNAHINPAKVEPKKLGIVTTEGIATQAPEPITRGSDLSKMITSHDVDGMMGALGYKRVEERDVEDHSKSNTLLNEGLPEPEPKKKAKAKKSA